MLPGERAIDTSTQQKAVQVMQPPLKMLKGFLVSAAQGHVSPVPFTFFSHVFNQYLHPLKRGVLECLGLGLLSDSLWMERHGLLLVDGVAEKGSLSCYVPPIPVVDLRRVAADSRDGPVPHLDECEHYEHLSASAS